jgi:hypothetical protein
VPERYIYGIVSSNACPTGSVKIMTAVGCEAAAAATQSAAAAAGMTNATYGGVMPSSASYPKGCFYYSSGSIMRIGVWFNAHATGAARSTGRLLCDGTRGYERLLR